jgi:probable HAF family extracellular repeat protein
MNKTCLPLVFLAAAITIGADAATFHGLGDLPGRTFDSIAYDVSDDGSIVIGSSSSASGIEAFRWTLEGGMIGLGDLTGGGFDSTASAISGDGSTIVGRGLGANGREAFRWTSGGGMVGLGDLVGGGFKSEAGSVSYDGSVIVGFGTAVPTAGNGSGEHAVMWSNAGGPVSIGQGGASGVSSDGLIIAGANPSGDAFRWTAGTGMVGIGNSREMFFATESISPDGSVIVGWRGSVDEGGPGGIEAFRWSEAAGMVGLGDLPGGVFYSYAFDQSQTGRYIVGQGNSSRGGEAFIWDDEHGMRDLRTVLMTEYGLTELFSWNLDTAWAITPDGSTIVGSGTNPSGEPEAWRVTGVPEPSVAGLLAAGVVLLTRRSRRR